MVPSSVGRLDHEESPTTKAGAGTPHTYREHIDPHDLKTSQQQQIYILIRHVLKINCH